MPQTGQITHKKIAKTLVHVKITQMSMKEGISRLVQ